MTQGRLYGRTRFPLDVASVDGSDGTNEVLTLYRGVADNDYVGKTDGIRFERDVVNGLTAYKRNGLRCKTGVGDGQSLGVGGSLNVEIAVDIGDGTRSCTFYEDGSADEGNTLFVNHLTGDGLGLQGGRAAQQ